jgi:Leucine-rich repeat (LRR) protein
MIPSSIPGALPMHPRAVRCTALIICWGTLHSEPSFAQAPKEKGPVPRPRFAAQQIAEAETKLKELSCSLHYEESKKNELDEPPMKAPRGPVDIVAIPDTTNDTELAKMIPWLKRLPALRTIDLAQNRALTTKGYKLLTQIPDLQALMLDGTAITNDGLKELSGITSLHWLDISRTQITDAGIPLLARIERLQTLLIKDVPRLTESGLADLKELKTLRVLHITVDKDPRAMTAHISKLKNLLELSIRPIGNDEAEQIASLENLQILDVGNLTSDDGVAFRGATGKPGRRMPAKKVGKIDPDKPAKKSSANEITDTGLRSLVKLKNLRILDVSGNPVTVAGAKELATLETSKTFVFMAPTPATTAWKFWPTSSRCGCSTWATRSCTIPACASLRTFRTWKSSTFLARTLAMRGFAKSAACAP